MTHVTLVPSGAIAGADAGPAGCAGEHAARQDRRRPTRATGPPSTAAYTSALPSGIQSNAPSPYETDGRGGWLRRDDELGTTGCRHHHELTSTATVVTNATSAPSGDSRGSQACAHTHTSRPSHVVPPRGRYPVRCPLVEAPQTPTATSPWSWSGSPKPPRWPPPAGWAGATRTAPTAPRSTPCAPCCPPSRWTASSSSARARRTKRRCSTTASAIGDGTRPLTDIAVDPIDGTTLDGARPRQRARRHRGQRAGHDVRPRPVRLHGEDRRRPRGRRRRSTSPPPPPRTCAAVAKAKGESVRDLTAVILDRDRHDDLIAEVRAAGRAHPADPRR